MINLTKIILLKLSEIEKSSSKYKPRICVIKKILCSTFGIVCLCNTFLKSDYLGKVPYLNKIEMFLEIFSTF